MHRGWRRQEAPAKPLLVRAEALAPAPRLDPLVATSRKAPFTATQFHVLLTLSSKFFSNFHHCTCLLSVSGPYLALRGVYLALRAALSSNPTRRRGQQSRTTALRAYHPLGAAATVKLNLDWRPSFGRGHFCTLHSARLREHRRFSDGLFPFHSPLLRESQLFSFPPLINMLKFGG